MRLGSDVLVGVTTIASATSTAIAIGSLRRLGLMDVPNSRSSHREPIVRGVGIGPLLVAVLMVAVVREPTHRDRLLLAAAATGFGLVGFADDWSRGLTVRLRLTVSIVLALTIAYSLLPADPFWMGLAAVGVLAYVNIFNFMDGINGISAAHVIVVAVAIALSPHGAPWQAVALIIGSAALGFLPFNAPIARGILGDVGSYFFGSALALLAVVSIRDGAPWPAVLAPACLYCVDTLQAIIRRSLRHESLTVAHRHHVYQRLVDGGQSHAVVCLIVTTLTAVCAVIGRSLTPADVPTLVGGATALSIVVAFYLLLPTLLQLKAHEVH